MTMIQRVAAAACAALVLAGAGDAAARPMRMCPMIWRPVCAVKFGHPKTYSNRCVAQNARARVVHDGRCRRH